MRSLDHFRVTGVSKLTRATAHIELDALSEADARGKAELQSIAVASVRRLTPVLTSDAGLAGVALGHSFHGAPIAESPEWHRPSGR